MLWLRRVDAWGDILFFTPFQIFGNNQIANRMKINKAQRNSIGWFIAANIPAMTAIFSPTAPAANSALAGMR